jgi:hypothetical protein
MDVYERLDDISADTAEARAAWILHGLGFTKEMQGKKTKDFSGEYQIMFNKKYICLQFGCVCLAVHIVVDKLLGLIRHLHFDHRREYMLLWKISGTNSEKISFGYSFQACVQKVSCSRLCCTL